MGLRSRLDRIERSLPEPGPCPACGRGGEPLAEAGDAMTVPERRELRDIYARALARPGPAGARPCPRCGRAGADDPRSLARRMTDEELKRAIAIHEAAVARRAGRVETPG